LQVAFKELSDKKSFEQSCQERCSPRKEKASLQGVLTPIVAKRSISPSIPLQQVAMSDTKSG
jgi:hypothetical protein